MKNSPLYILILILIFASLIYGFLNVETHEITNESKTEASINSIDLIYEKFETLTPDLTEYIWPTDASQRITSTFAEYRNNHFHGGIDISTNKRNGYKVFAAREGYIYRIINIPNGYGKMLYVKHPDGYYSTYAHLSTFSKEINRYLKEEQYRRQQYFVDLVLDSVLFPVTKGQIIAYTGDTGAGPPHLHFEIRDNNMNPVNPFHFENLLIQDNVPPIIKKIFVAPQGLNSTVNGNNSYYFFSNPNRGSRNAKIHKPIEVTGKARMGIETIDLANEASNRSGIYTTEFFLNDHLVFVTKFDRIPSQESRQIHFHYDLPLILENKGKFQKLYVEEGITLPIYNRLPFGSGIIDSELLKEGIHPFKIIVMDFSGNKSVINGEILITKPPVISIEKITDNEIIVDCDNLNSINNFIVYGKRYGTTEWKKQIIPNGTFLFKGTKVGFPFEKGNNSVLKIIAENKSGAESTPVFYHLNKSDGSNYNSLKIKKDFFHDYVIITVETAGEFTEAPVIQITEGSSIRTLKTKAVDIKKYQIQFIPSFNHSGKRFLKINAEVNGRKIVESDNFELFPVLHDSSGSFTAGKLFFSYKAGAVFKPVFLRVDSTLVGEKKIYSIYPQDLLLNKGLSVSVKPENHNDGLFFAHSGKWRFQTNNIDIKTGNLTASLTRTLTDISLMTDNQKPFISKLVVKARNQKPFFSFRYGDSVSGIDYEIFQVHINDKLIIPEVNVENKRVSFESEEKFKKGNHTLKIDISDKAGNRNQLITNFRVQ